MIEVVFFENGKQIGTMEPSKFMKHLERDFGSNKFLSEYVRLWNDSRSEPNQAIVRLK